MIIIIQWKVTFWTPLQKLYVLCWETCFHLSNNFLCPTSSIIIIYTLFQNCKKKAETTFTLFILLTFFPQFTIHNSYVIHQLWHYTLFLLACSPAISMFSHSSFCFTMVGPDIVYTVLHSPDTSSCKCTTAMALGLYVYVCWAVS